MKATTETPKEPGWYWFRADERSPGDMQALFAPHWLVVNVYEGGRARHLVTQFYNRSYHVEEMGGQWCGPLKEPEA